MPQSQLIRTSFRKLYAILALVGLLLLAAIIISGLWVDRGSCIRSNEVRKTQHRIAVKVGIESAPILDCSGLRPER